VTVSYRAKWFRKRKVQCTATQCSLETPEALSVGYATHTEPNVLLVCRTSLTSSSAESLQQAPSGDRPPTSAHLPSLQSGRDFRNQGANHPPRTTADTPRPRDCLRMPLFVQLKYQATATEHICLLYTANARLGSLALDPCTHTSLHGIQGLRRQVCRQD